MPTFRIIAIGASAGGLQALIKLSRELPADLPVPVFIVLHVPPFRSSALPSLLSRARRLPADYAEDGELIRPSRIYVAPPDRHLVVRGDRVHLGTGPRENGTRPAIDPLFRSVAMTYGPGAIGVVLSGALYDGTAGLHAIKEHGGIAIVQNPDEALHPSMPRTALENVNVDHIVGAEQLAPLLEKLVRGGSRPAVSTQPAQPERLAHEVEIAERGAPPDQPAAKDQGRPSAFSCPDCHGVLWEIEEGDLIRFRCRVGHGYLPEALAQAQSAELEEALWTALRSLRENAALATRLGERARLRNLTMIAQAHEGRAKEAQERAQRIEAVLKRGQLSASEREASGDDQPAEPMTQ